MESLASGTLEGTGLNTAPIARETASRPESSEYDALIESARAELAGPGWRYLIYHDSGTLQTMALGPGSMRIGRSLSADLRFEDPTVSRRHAVLVGEEDAVRVLDDRSLNGVFVNGRRISSHVLEDRDEILIGRYRLRFADLSPAVAVAGTGALQAQ
jgi:hypothetical protein